MFQLGNRQYTGFLGFGSLEYTKTADYKEHALIGIKPRLQRVGDALETLQLTLKLHAQYCTPEDEIEALENSREIGEILGFYNAAGRYYNDYLIKSLRVREEQLGPDAGLMLATVEVELLEYFYTDREAALRRRARQVAFALDSTATPFPEVYTATTTAEAAALATATASGVAAPTLPSIGAKKTNTAQILGRLQQIAGTVLRLAGSIQQAVNNPSRRAYLLADAARQAGDLSGQAGGLISFLTNTPSPTGATSGLLYALSGSGLSGGVVTLAGQLRTQANAGNLSGAVSASGGLLSEQNKIRAASQEIATNAAVGRNIL